MKRAEVDADQMPGQDSFLDVITNMVGILILLVLVVGIRTQRSVHSGPDVQAAEQLRSENEVRKAYSSALTTERNVREMVQRVSSARHETAFREEERAWMSENIAAAEKEISDRRAQLSTSDQRDFDLRQKLATAQSTLDDLTRQQVALMAREPNQEEIECQPTPVAKTVTGTEVHVLLSGDHVAVVPFDELLEQMKIDAQANVWRLKQQSELERTIGPINGFRLRYAFVKEGISGRSEAGTQMSGSVCRFSHCYVLPVANPGRRACRRGALGQVGTVPAATALSPGRHDDHDLDVSRQLRTTPRIEAHDPPGRISNRRAPAPGRHADGCFAPWQQLA